MAYRKTRSVRRTSYSRSGGARRSYGGARARRTSARRRSSVSRSGVRPVRIEIITRSADAVARPEMALGLKPAPAPRRSAF